MFYIMKSLSALTVALASTVLAQTERGPSYYFEMESLANHTFYQPLESAAGSKLKLPVVIWGNGACYVAFEGLALVALLMNLVGATFRNFLGEIASHGALAIATGAAFVDPGTYVEPPSDPSNPASGQNPAAMTEAIDWVHANAGKGAWKHIDSSRIGVWGQSCGGLETYLAGANDPRVGHLGIFNSGLLNETSSAEIAGKLTKPIFYIIGGPGDIAYPNAERDYASLPANTPSWKGNHALGHSAGFYPANTGGIPGVVGRYMLQWLLRGDSSAKRWFTGSGPAQIGVHDVEYQNLEKIKVSPIKRH
ncbi:putative secreted lipase [Paramyrothecium foliicola]|nr:putative secreted lipase [Paramyrothecium foliicola]